MNPSDHDLLIRLDENVRNSRIEVGRFNDTAVGNFNSLQVLKLDKASFEEFKDDVNTAVSDLKKANKETSDKQDKQGRYINIGIGIVITLQFIALIVASLKG